ncbi:hypothetical protein [Microbaculum sp. FT89]|uniref:hypothetical protein n=1 Tax=Microbaculum sp. FT89 TaxID=3447298 RepID=UPI003F537C1D
MTADLKVLEQVKSYLATLSPRLRAKLVSEIEAQRLKGSADVAQEVVLDLLRGVMRAESAQARQSGTPERAFSEPLEPFLVDEAGPRKLEGVIARQSLDALWRWLQREDAIGGALHKATEDANAALLAGDDERANGIMAGLRADIVPIIEAALADAADDPRREMKLAMQLDGQRGFDDLKDIMTVMRLEERINKVVARLPATIGDLDDDLIAKIVHRTRDVDGDLLYLLVPVYRRLAHPAHIIRILTEYENTDKGSRLVESRFAPCAEIVLTDVELAADRIAMHMGRPGEFDRLLEAIKRFYTLANGLGVAIELDDATGWLRRLTDQRKRASEILSAEVQTIPGSVRRAMRPRRRDGERGAASDDDVQDAEHAVRLMVALKPYRGELAVNELLGTVVGQVETFIEAANAAILHDIRKSSGAALEAARRDLEVAVRINAVVLGETYASLLKRSGDAAGPVPSRFDLYEDDEDGGEADAASAAA